MTIHEKIKNDLKKALIKKDRKTRDYLRLILGEIQHYYTENVIDDKIVIILEKLLKAQEDLKGSEKHDIKFIEIITSYIPNPASRDEIISWVRKNMDLMGLKSPIQAMKPVMREFAGRIEAETVKEILRNMEV